MDGLLVIRTEGNGHRSPQRSARGSREQKRDGRHARHPRERRRNQRKSGDEFRDQQGSPAPAVHRNRDPARRGCRHREEAVDTAQRSATQAGAREVPHVVGDQGYEHGAPQQDRPGELLAGRKCARDEERRGRGKRQPRLREEHVSPYQQQTVALDEECKVFQRRLPIEFDAK